MNRVTIMARLKFIGLFTLSHGGNRNQQGERVPLMWPAAFCSGLAALSCGWAELWKNPPTLKKQTKKARWTWWLAICVCKACLSGLGCLWVWWKGREPSWKTGIITQLSGKGTVESWLFGLVGPPDFMLAGMCVTWLHSRCNDRE